MEMLIEWVDTRTARCRIENGVLRVKMPRRWPADFREKTLEKFARWAEKQAALTQDLPPLDAWDGREWTQAAFEAYVLDLNARTLGLPVEAVRIGKAKKSRLAQCNTRTGVLTFSRYAINGMPERALRYLVLHELAHLRHADHSPRFWALVARHEPDYKRQRAIAQAHHQRMVETDALEKKIPAAPAVETTGPAPAWPAAPANPWGPLFMGLSPD